MEWIYTMLGIAQVVLLLVGLFFSILLLIHVCKDAYESCKHLREEESGDSQ